MDKYFYLVSQLPTLAFGSESGFEVGDFLRQAHKWLSPRDWDLLSQVSLAGPVPSGRYPLALRRYMVFEEELRRDIICWREAQRQGKRHQGMVFPTALVEEGTPLEVEKKLLKLRWDFIETLEIEHYFDLEFLSLFLLKLQILQRLSSFERDKGLARFRQLCEVDR